MLCGAFLGISVIAPGVSGSIMAVMMGIYDDLIVVISNPFKNFKKNFVYLLPMVIGAGISMLALLEVLELLFDNFRVPAYLLFMSLIAGSIPTVWSETKKSGIKKIYFLASFFALLFALSVGILAKVGFSFGGAESGFTSTLPYFLICGFVSGMMSMVPGMSVSMILMMLSAYDPLLEAAAKLDVLTVVPVGLCFVVGMVLFSNITKRIFEKYRGFGFVCVMGFMTGSLISVFPGLPNGVLDWILSFAAIFVGLSISYLFRMLGKKFNVEK